MKYILILILLLCPFNIFAQKEEIQKEEIYYQYEQKTTEEIKLLTHVNWVIENENEWGSFMWIVIRTQSIDKDGNYWYYVYLYSNSYFNRKDNNNYQKAISYISDLHVYMTEYVENKAHVYDYYIPYITCDYGEIEPNSYIAVFSSKSKMNKFNVQFSECSAYTDSKIK